MTDSLDCHLDALALIAARVLLSVPFIFGGIHNLFAYSGFAGYLASRGMPIPTVLAAPSVIADLVGGLMLVFGIRLRVLAPCLALYTIFTAFVGHPFWTFDEPMVREDMTLHFWKNMAIAGGLLGMFVVSAVQRKGQAGLKLDPGL